MSDDTVRDLARSLLLYRMEEMMEECEVDWRDNPNDYTLQLWEVAQGRRKSINNHPIPEEKASELKELAEQADIWYYCVYNISSKPISSWPIKTMENIANKIWEIENTLSYSEERWRKVHSDIWGSCLMGTGCPMIEDALTIRRTNVTAVTKELKELRKKREE